MLPDGSKPFRVWHCELIYLPVSKLTSAMPHNSVRHPAIVGLASYFSTCTLGSPVQYLACHQMPRGAVFSFLFSSCTSQSNHLEKADCFIPFVGLRLTNILNPSRTIHMPRPTGWILTSIPSCLATTYAACSSIEW